MKPTRERTCRWCGHVYRVFSAAQIRAIRKTRGRSAQAWAKHLGINITYLSGLENRRWPMTVRLQRAYERIVTRGKPKEVKP